MRNEFRINVRTVLHAGANLCQERDLYSQSGVKYVCWIEGLPSVVKEARAVLENYAGQEIYQAALWSSSDMELIFNVTSNNAESSSLLDLKLHKALHPTIETSSKVIVNTITLDDFLVAEDLAELNSIDLLVLDLQGSEYEILLGSHTALGRTKAIHVEVSTIELYEGQRLFFEVDSLLKSSGFTLVDHDLSDDNLSGDALYVRSNFLKHKNYIDLPSANAKLRLPWKGKIKYFALQIGVPGRYLQKRKFRN